MTNAPGNIHLTADVALAPGLLGAVRYLAAFIAMGVNGRNSDSERERRWHPAIPMFIPATGVLGTLRQPRSMPLSEVVLLHGVSVPSAAPDILGNPDGILSQAAAAAAAGMSNAVGRVAGIAAIYAVG